MSLPGQRILVVEDNESWVDLLRAWLKHAGFHDVAAARTGREAVELARRSLPDCILLDLVLPDIDGLEVCKLIRSMPALSRTPIVMMTAHRKEKLEGLEVGADYFVQKSENPAELIVTLRAVFRRRELDADLLRKGDVTLDLDSRHVYFQDMKVAALTPKVFELFHILLQRGPEPVDKEVLFTAVAGRKRPELSRALDILMNRLRKALPVLLGERIKAVKGFGYVYLAGEPGPRG